MVQRPKRYDCTSIQQQSFVLRQSTRAVVLAVSAVMFAIPWLTSCGSGSLAENGFPNPKPLPVKLIVSPSSATVAPGSIITFTASPNPLPGFSLAWSVNPGSAGTITNSGVFTAEETGNCSVVATWIPSSPSSGNVVSGSAPVKVLQPAMPSSDLAQASGAIQTAGPIENSGVVGELIPSVKSTDASGNVQAQSGFAIPIPCPPNGVCY